MFAQFYTLPNNYIFQQIQDYHLLKADTTLPTSVYPFNPFIVHQFSAIDTSKKLFKYIKNDPALDVIFEKNLVDIKKEEFQIRIDPLLNFQKGKQTADTNISAYSNTRGFIGSVQFKNVYIETMLSENQSIFPDYLYTFSKNTQVVPGQGRWKLFKKNGFDYAFSAGLVSVKVNEHIYLTAGTGKQKIGNGYRSMILSDNAFVYPYFKIEQQWWKGRLQYICNYAMLNNLIPASIKTPPNTERLFQKKPFVYQYLNVGITKHLRVGLFQGIIGESADTKNVWRGDGIIFSPVIFSQEVYYGLGSKNNVLLGLDIQQQFKTSMIYGQFVLDDNKKNILSNDYSYAYQLGFKWLSKINDEWRIFLLAEMNGMSKYTYTSPVFDVYSNSSYSHFNQNLAFTPINVQNELLSILSIKKNRWLWSGQFSYQQREDYNMLYYKTWFGFIINPSYNLMINFGYENRSADKNSNYIYLQLQTALYNIYYDF